MAFALPFGAGSGAISRPLLFVAALIAPLLVPALAVGQTIDHVDMTIVIGEDDSIDVTETWDISIESSVELRAVNRDEFFPSAYKSSVSFGDVTRNGEPEVWTLESRMGSFDLALGKPDSTETIDGQQRFVFRYRATDFVERDWSDPGLEWRLADPLSPFRFDAESTASITVHGAPGMHLDVVESQMSKPYMTNGDALDLPATVTAQGKTETVMVAVIGGLQDRRPVSIRIRLSPGFIADTPEHLYSSLYRTGGLWGPAGLLLTIAYYLRAIRRVRRQMTAPAKPTGAALSPAEMRYLDRGRYDTVMLPIALLSLMRKGLIEIGRLPGGLQQFVRGSNGPSAATLSDDERRLLSDIFPAGTDTITISAGSSLHFKSVPKSFQNSMEWAFGYPSPQERWHWLHFGLLVTTGSMLLMGLGLGTQADWVSYLAIFFVVSMMFCGIPWEGTKLWDAFRQGTLHRHLWSCASMLLVVPISFYFVSDRLPRVIDIFGYGILLHLAVATILSAFLMRELRRKAQPGAEAAQQIDAMRARLAAAFQERDRLGAAAPFPDELLPYAVALDRDGLWIRSLRDRIRSLLTVEQGSGQKPWYDNKDIGLVDFGYFRTALREP